jgi:SMODS and SLOG-associating 2TM effector domain 1/SMODS and SLOG-associating 2TM effector domain 3
MAEFDPKSDYPALFNASDKAAWRSQKSFVICIWVNALTMIAGTFFAGEIFERGLAAYLAAALFLGSIFVSILMAFRKYEDIWYRARAIAESVKTISWRFMMRAAPYDSTSTTDAEKHLHGKFKSLLKEHRGVSHEIGGLAASGDQITNRMYQTRSLTLSERKSFYLLHRVQEQQTWYAAKSGTLLRRGQLWFAAMIGLQCLALLFVLRRIQHPDTTHWPAEALAVAAGAVLTWTQVRRFRELASAYALTAHEIGLIKIRWKDADSEDSFSDFVKDSENAFSREHTQWSARLDTE